MKKPPKSLLPIMAIPTIALTGCGGDDGPSFDAELLEGTWISTSYEDSDGDETGYEVLIEFDNDEFIACINPFISGNYLYCDPLEEGDWTLSGDLVTLDITGESSDYLFRINTLEDDEMSGTFWDESEPDYRYFIEFEKVD